LLEKLSFPILDAQHRERFITSLFPHIHVSLNQQKFSTWYEALEYTMELEASPASRKNNAGMAQF